ncbi:MAG: hypothetical protein L0Z48_06600 [candidate division Zixibacteria bacterium]|nr:hypothetical protein [candidate division Zixibacteria bacterium]MCI0596194.1 hypothetical protein [candidate division Zixibacteria bacterium]
MKRLLIFLTGVALLSWLVAATAMADVKPVGEGEEVLQVQPVPPSGQTTGTPVPPVRSTSPQVFQLNWLSINGGGAINATSASYQLGLSVGQSVAGYATSPSYQMGIGFWYGAAAGAPACAAAKGDLNGAGGLSPADVVLMLNCVFTGNGAGTVGGDCNLCYADVNCAGGLTPSDVVLELLAVFNGQPFPC